MMTDPALFFAAFELTTACRALDRHWEPDGFSPGGRASVSLCRPRVLRRGDALCLLCRTLFQCSAMVVVSPPVATIAFFCRVVVIPLIDRVIPYHYNPHEVWKVKALGLVPHRSPHRRGDRSSQHPRRDRRLGADLLCDSEQADGVPVLPPLRACRTSGAVLDLLFTAVAGIMVFVAVDELLPAAREYGEAHLAVYA